MPDMIQPVGALIKAPDPNQGLSLLSGVLGVQQQRQALQTGQYQQQSAQADAIQNQQRSQELQRAQQVALSGAQSGRYLNADGSLDRQRMADDISTVAPTYGQAVSGQLLSAANEIVRNKQDLQNLNVSQRAQVGSVLGSLATDPNLDHGKVVDALGQLAQDNPAVARMTISLGASLPPNASPKDLQAAMRRAALATTGVENATGQSAPNVGTMQAPGGLQAINTNPQAPGGVSTVGQPMPQGIAPGANLVTDAYGHQFVLDPRTNTVRPVGTGGAVGGGTPSAPPAAPGAPARPTAGGFHQPVAGQPQILESIENARAVGDTAPTTRNVNSQLLKLSQETATGPGTQTAQKIAAILGMPSGSGYQEIGAYLDRQAALQARSMGVPNTNAGLQAAERASGTTEYTPHALQEKVKFADALNSGAMAYRQGLDKTVGTGPTPDLGKYQQFRSAWAQNFDPDVFRAEDAMRRGDKAELNSLKQRLGPAGMRILAQKSANLRQLENGQIPP